MREKESESFGCKNCPVLEDEVAERLDFGGEEEEEEDDDDECVVWMLDGVVGKEDIVRFVDRGVKDGMNTDIVSIGSGSFASFSGTRCSFRDEIRLFSVLILGRNAAVVISIFGSLRSSWDRHDPKDSANDVCSSGFTAATIASAR